VEEQFSALMEGVGLDGLLEQLHEAGWSTTRGHDDEELAITALAYNNMRRGCANAWIAKRLVSTKGPHGPMAQMQNVPMGHLWAQE
jgi:hypothetical protein